MRVEAGYLDENREGEVLFGAPVGDGGVAERVEKSMRTKGEGEA